MTNILYIINVGYQGGVEKFTLDLVNGHFVNKKYRPILLFLNDGEFAQSCRANYDDVFILPFKLKLKNPLSVLKLCFWLLHFLRDHKISLVHIAMPWAKIICALPLMMARVPVVWFQHGPIGKLLDRIASLLPYEKIIFYNSQYTRECYEAVSCLSLSNKKYAIIHPMIAAAVRNESEINLIKEKYTAPSLWLCAGRICSWKGYELAIYALKNYLEQKGEAHLLIIGSATRASDQPYEQSLRGLVRELNLENHVSFIAHSENWHQYLYAADLFLHTSRIPEPFGLVIGEAMLCECLVIGSNQGGARELLIEGQTGYSYDSCQDFSSAVIDLTKTITKLENNALKGVKMSAKNHISNVMNSSKVTDKIESYYLEIIRLN